MNDSNHHPVRKRVRLKRWDYRRRAAYAVTICTVNRECLLGEVVRGEMGLSPLGKQVDEIWRDLAREPNVELDEHVVMPNHIHGILILKENPAGLNPDTDAERHFEREIHGSVASLVRRFKARVTQAVRKDLNALGPGRDKSRPYVVWQTGFYEHVIRDQQDFESHRQYIVDNVRQWEFDRENPAAINRGAGKKAPKV